MRTDKMEQLIKAAKPQELHHTLWGRFEERLAARRQGVFRPVYAAVAGGMMALALAAGIWLSPLATKENGFAAHSQPSSVAYESPAVQTVDYSQESYDTLDYYYSTAIEI